ncbi:MAG: nucleotidyltransferase [Verrucomicrobia bacterium]|nr:nucleotidyltransferase [Verrucomicrobiota bacterium]
MIVATPEERLAVARKGAALLYAHGARNVCVFGSVARWREQDERSDVDLAVEGLLDHLYLQTLGELMSMFPCPVDLVEMEKASPLLRENIRRFCILLPREN